MERYIIQLIMAGFGSAGFGLLFRVRRDRLPLAAMGGILCWLAYLGSRRIWSGVFVPSLAASVAAALYAEILARTCKAPSTPFFALSEIPLIPGSSLYYCMLNAAEGNGTEAVHYGLQTFAVALGIAAGMSMVWALCDFSRKAAAWRNKKREGGGNMLQ